MGFSSASTLYTLPLREDVRERAEQTLAQRSADQPERDTFSIYQVPAGPEGRDFRYRPYEELQAAGLTVDRKNYALVYTAPLDGKTTLEDIYRTFNADDRPAGFRGHSLSVSDVVVINRGGKEGRKSRKVADLSEFWRGQREIKLMDANLLACPDHESLLLQLAGSRALVDFSQGLDIRLITRDNVALLNQVRTKAVHFAWDNPDEDLTRYFRQFLEWTSIRNPRLRRVYLLTNYGSTHEQDLYRVETLRQMGFDPYVMIYEKPTAPPITRHLQRWVNNKRLFHAVQSFSDYEPVKKLLAGQEEMR